MIVKLDRFMGVAPRVAPHLLPATHAAEAINCYFASGALRALRSSSVVSLSLTGSGEIKSIYRHDTPTGSYWFSFAEVTDLAPSPVTRDGYRRLYYVNGSSGFPQVVPEAGMVQGDVNPTLAGPRRLGLPVPDITGLAPDLPSGGDSSQQDTRYYALTWVSEFGEESQPSALLGPFVVNSGQSVVITSPDPPNREACGAVITKWNIYRSNKGTSATKLQFVASIALSQSRTYEDSLPSSALSEVLPSATWAAPVSGMAGLTIMACGSLAAFYGRQLAFSEPLHPHAWPVEYERPLDYDIVGLGAFGRSLLVLTNGYPYVFTGDHPNALERQRVDDGLACVSKRSIVDLGSGVCYATPEGIMFVGSAGVKLVTAELFDRKEWEKLNPASIHGYNFGGRYVGFYAVSDTERRGFILDLDGNWSWLDFYASAGWYDHKSGNLYLIIDQAAYLFDSGEPLTCAWLSPPMLTNRLLNFGVARVRAPQYPVAFALYTLEDPAAPALRYARAVPDDKPFPLPAGFRADAWQIGAGNDLDVVWLAESRQELMSAQ